MEKKLLFSMASPYRDTFRIWGYHFGGNKNTVAIIGALRGDEVQQQYICAQLVKKLKELESQGMIDSDKGVMVVPSANPFSMNIGKRFWAMDGTDINRMFPGYDLGETTQRIASGLFESIKDFEYGIQLASYYLPGTFIPHIRIIKTGYEDVEAAKSFSLPYICLKDAAPFDTATLNYNWQIWDTKAYMIYSGQNSDIGTKESHAIVNSILRFLTSQNIIKSAKKSRHPAYSTEVFQEENLESIHSKSAGIFEQVRYAGDEVWAGDVLARITDPYDGSILEEVVSPVDGVIFYAVNKPLALLHTPLFRILPLE